ncbi:MAG: TIGR04255 family protein [Deltaproteobacteria bacterium]|nr:TIGR04255 family protein [Deltaproteobacteria bacterium]
MNSDHPTYPNPTIQEAVIEVHFERPSNQPWSASNFASYFEKVKGDYPLLEPVQQVGFQMLVGPQGVSQQMVPAEQRMKYTHKDNQFLIQLSDRLFVQNVLPKYPSWKLVKASIEVNWKACVDTIGECKPKRVGMRYINRIPRGSPTEKPRVWFKPNDYIATSALDSLAPVFSRVETKTDSANVTMVTLAEGENAFILDIDRVLSCPETMNSTDLISTLETLHDGVWVVFKSTCSDKLESLLNQKN